jgi:hypothetical protein
MDEGEVILRFGLPPRADDLPAIRVQLDEATRLECDDEGDTLVMKALCVLLFAARHVEDSLAIWRAKRASFDAGFSIDVQLLCGAGFDATLRYLREVDSEDAREALAYILECEAAGDFVGSDEPGGRLSEVLPAYRRYYRLDAISAASD